MTALRTSPAALRSGPDWAVWTALLLGALLLTLKYFPGFENETAYAGNAFQTLHPDAFWGDPYRDPTRPLLQRPFQLSLFYALIKVTGEVWLDDRFACVIYFGLVAAALAGLDRIAVLVGVQGRWQRLVILLLFLKDHQILGNKVLVAHHPDLNHFAMAIPLLIWLTYAALARKGLATILALSALLLAVSVRNAVFPVMVALVVAAVNGGKRERWVVAALFGLGLVAAWVGIARLFAMSPEFRLQLWDMIRMREHAAANPFHPLETAPMWRQNVLWVGLCFAALVGSAPNQAFRSLRLVIWMGLAVWLVGGLYITFAPDAIKVPLLIPLAPARVLALPQNLAYVAIPARLFLWLGARYPVGAGRACFAALVIGLIMVLGPGNEGQWAALLAIAAAIVLVLGWRKLGPAKGARLAAQVPFRLAQGMALALAVSYAGALYRNAPAWKMLVETGVYGNSEGAKWAGVAEYIRANTPERASVLPLFLAETGELAASDALGSRAGRAMPVPEWYSNILNPDSWRLQFEQERLDRDIAAAYRAGRLDEAEQLVAKLVPVPDYILIPTTVLPQPGPELTYREEARIGAYTLLKKGS